ncbi:MAG TPA: tRNA glutamyl-Q(34) synthetase GluQRS [Aquihabitans sp.]|nr:tRNA glutamyl-Q(34) synthetase GluQRS [Aquihabitans sp.]
MASGRFAPSPTGDLHLGNLRTALLAWLFARSAGSWFLLRMEDLDRSQASARHERSQLADLAALGLDWDGQVVRQSERFDRYEAAIATLDAAGRTYSCYCTRREIREAASAPHVVPGPDGAYPGTCRELTAAERAERERAGRPPALRLRGPGTARTVDDDLLGPVTALVDDVVLRRNDGVPAYNLAVVVDDAAQGVEQVVRGDDLAASAPRQRHLSALLGLPPVRYAHVPLVLGPTGQRLAKRDGAVTLADQAAAGHPPDEVRSLLAASLGLAEPGEPATTSTLLARFDPARLPREPWTVPPC